jgi:MFS transporter, OFA family, oxalate/formate antiporter
LKKGWIVTFAGTGINLALGILYTWSIFRSEIQRSIVADEGFEIGGFDWSLAAINDPYAVCCLVFAFSMIPAGKFQDKLGPRLTAAIGGVLVGLGFLLISQSTEYWVWILGFGVMVGAGIGCGYSSATPAAIKWFPAAKTGLVAGLVVSGFGLAPAYISPLSNYLIANYGLIQTMQIFGVAFFFIVVSSVAFSDQSASGVHSHPSPRGHCEKDKAGGGGNRVTNASSPEIST